MKLKPTNLLKIAIMSTMCASTAFGWTLKIKNLTSYKAWIGVRYAWGICRRDDVTIEPGETREINAGACSVTAVEGVLSLVPGDPSHNVTLKIDPKTAKGGTRANPAITGTEFTVEIVHEGGSYWLVRK